jgi:DNA-directed RNA polymerase specialized sigma24 family protein
MARIQEIDRRLWLWAEALKVGDGSGYPVKNTLHEDWSPPSPGMTPTMKVSRADGSAKQMTRAVQQLSQTLQATLVAHYLVRMTAADIGLALGCKADTVHARIEAAHRELAGLLRLQASEFCNIQ